MQEYTYFVYKNDPFLLFTWEYICGFFLYFYNVKVNKIFEGISINTKLNKKLLFS